MRIIGTISGAIATILFIPFMVVLFALYSVFILFFNLKWEICNLFKKVAKTFGSFKNYH